jgi:N6-L-threonylcarbamoyladenine synthase
MIVLGIETSCDETSAALVRDGRQVLSTVVSSQVEHLEYGGVVPEIAARAHLRQLRAVVQRALDDAGLTLDAVDAVAATRGPGLIGALLVGFGFGGALALARGIPFAAVNHIEAHLLSPLLSPEEFGPPFLGLVVSGGHTELILSEAWHRYRILGSTLDDAAGEAFDKVAVLLEIGYPGGPVVEQAALSGRPDAYAFPRAWLKPGSLDVSLSGLKTAVRLAVEKRRAGLGLAADEPLPPGDRADLAASFQEAVVEVLAARLRQALQLHRPAHAVVAGGVAANRSLRERARAVCEEQGVTLHLPPLAYCGDNAAMVAAVGWARLSRGERWPLSTVPVADLERLGL